MANNTKSRRKSNEEQKRLLRIGWDFVHHFDPTRRKRIDEGTNLQNLTSTISKAAAKEIHDTQLVVQVGRLVKMIAEKE